MDSLTSGTFAGAGSFRCRSCGYALTLAGNESLTDCPMCGGHDFVRASLFSTERIAARQGSRPMEHEGTAGREWDVQFAHAREEIDAPGEYLLCEDGEEVRTVALTREWTRIGRSLAADLRFDDPTVSRRHALIVRQPDGVRLLDDRSLNGVFVNGSRVEGKTLNDGDELVVGRYRLMFVRLAGAGATRGVAAAPGEDSLHPIV